MSKCFKIKQDGFGTSRYRVIIAPHLVARAVAENEDAIAAIVLLFEPMICSIATRKQENLHFSSHTTSLPSLRGT